MRRRYWDDPGKARSYARKQYARNHEQLRAKSLAYWRSHREEMRQMHKEYRRRNLKRHNLERVIKRRSDVQFALRCRIRNHARKIVLCLPSFAPRSHYLDLLGCRLSELVSYLESKFLPGMSWENRNLWHLDHIRPLKTF